MILTRGKKDRFALCVQVCEIKIEKKEIWGGFELWLNNTRFGDINYFDLITGNNYSLAEDIVNNEVPKCSFGKPMIGSKILKEIFSNYSGDNLNEPRSLQESYAHSVYWGNFILLPNNKVPFDRTELVYFGDNETVNFLYNNNIDTNTLIGEYSMPTNEFKSVAKEFVDLYESIVEGRVPIELVDKSKFH